MNIDIICPLYNGEKYIEELDKNIKKQENVSLNSINYILTETNDNSKEILDKLNANYEVIEPKDFSHSLTREKSAMKCNADIIVFITQDIEIRNIDWLENLVKPIINNEVEACFSRQITKFDNIEKYTREKNYPDKSYIVSKKDLEIMGMRAFFFSDASSAIKTSVFKKLNGYDKKNFPTNEDQYIAYKIINNGYKIKYCSDSIIYHSHKLTLKQLYKRYYDTGLFYAKEHYLDKFGTNRTGGIMAKYIFKRALEDKNFKVILRFLPDMLVRFLGMKMGKIKGALHE